MPSYQSVSHKWRQIACTVACLMLPLTLHAWTLQQPAEKPAWPHFDSREAIKHEIKPLRHAIPHEGIQDGMNQITIRLTVSPAGDVLQASASGRFDLKQFWPEVEAEARGWKFTPFEKDGLVTTAEVDEYIELVPPERKPRQHVTPPLITAQSKVSIELVRSRCYGRCPAYRVTVSTEGIDFGGGAFVVATGAHKAPIRADRVRELAKKFVDADFYSMDDGYSLNVTDCPTYYLTITIDGRAKRVTDYMGIQAGMPAIITELEDEVDALGGTKLWIEGGDGFIDSLYAEKYDFKSFDAQVMLKQAARMDKVETVRDLLEAGVPLKQLPRPDGQGQESTLESDGWLSSASLEPKILRILIDHQASKNDQTDKDRALSRAARTGHVEAVQMLIAYGANPNVDLNRMTPSGPLLPEPAKDGKEGSILINAASSGNPDMIREILQYHPKLELRDQRGRTAVLAVVGGSYGNENLNHVQCLRVLAEAGANINARDDNGGTALHFASEPEVVEELLRLGAKVNARNENGETPVFTAWNAKAVQLLIQHGADLTIRNRRGETIFDASKYKSPEVQSVLRAVAQTAAQK